MVYIHCALVLDEITNNICLDESACHKALIVTVRVRPHRNSAVGRDNVLTRDTVLKPDVVTFLWSLVG